MKATKVCMVTIEFPPDPGGVGQSVFRIAKLLQDTGIEVHIVVFHPSQAESASESIGQRGFDREDYHGLPVYRSRPAVKSDVNPVVEFLSDMSIELKRLHEREKFDLFHAFFMNETGFVATLVARELGVPVINSFRGADLHKNVFGAKNFSQIIWSLESCSWATFVSRELERRAHLLAPSIVGKTSTFWNSIEHIDFDCVQAPVGKHDLRGTVVGSVGRFRDKKGIDYLVQACGELARELEITLLLVGDFVEKERRYWDQFITACGLADRLVLTGLVPRAEALQYFKLMDIFVMPSLRDGCPNSLLEAMMAGRPIVGTRTDAIGEIIQDGVNGLTTGVGSAAELRDRLRQLVADPDLRVRLGAAARRTAQEKLTHDVERANWLAVYGRVLQRNTQQHASVVASAGGG